MTVTELVLYPGTWTGSNINQKQLTVQQPQNVKDPLLLFA